jgi:DNA modification methylase
VTEPVHIGDATLYCADCMDILPTLGKVDAVVTDPPYGIDYQSGHATEALWVGGKCIIGDSDLIGRDGLITEFMRLQPFVPMLVFGSRKRDVPPACRMVLVWDKGPALGMGALDLPWKPSSEEIYVIGRGFIGERDESNVLYCPPVQSMAKNGRVHPNEKPIALLVRLLRKCPKRTILDPFMGSGTTGVACAKLGRKFIGIEIEPKYFDIACKRIEEAYRQPDFFVERPKAAEQLEVSL